MPRSGLSGNLLSNLTVHVPSWLSLRLVVELTTRRARRPVRGLSKQLKQQKGGLSGGHVPCWHVASRKSTFFNVLGVSGLCLRLCLRLCLCLRLSLSASASLSVSASAAAVVQPPERQVRCKTYYPLRKTNETCPKGMRNLWVQPPEQHL